MSTLTFISGVTRTQPIEKHVGPRFISTRPGYLIDKQVQLLDSRLLRPILC